MRGGICEFIILHTDQRTKGVFYSMHFYDALSHYIWMQLVANIWFCFQDAYENFEHISFVYLTHNLKIA